MVDVPTMLLDADDQAGLSAAIEGCESVISALSFRSNRAVAQARSPPEQATST